MDLSAHQQRRVRKDGLSVEIVPEASIDTTFQCPHIHMLFEGGSDFDCALPCIEKELSKDNEPSRDELRAQSTLMREVAEWVELNESDNNWAVRRRQWKNLLPTPSETIAQFSTHNSFSKKGDGEECSESTLYWIAIQLLASCYTLSAPPSADNLPLRLRRRQPEYMTTLRLHGQYRFSPAAGHHARESSAEDPSPGLYTGPSIEDQLAERVSEQRRRRNQASKEERRAPASQTTGRLARPLHRAICQWSDGPSETANTSPEWDSNKSTDSDSDSEAGCLPRLLSNPSRGPSRMVRLHRNGVASTSHLGNLKRSVTAPKPARPSRLSLKSLTSIFSTKRAQSPTELKIPSQSRLRRTQSMLKEPSDANDESLHAPSLQDSRRSSSSPTVRSPLLYAYEVPAIRRTSATPTVWTEEEKEKWSMQSHRWHPLPAEEYFEGVEPGATRYAPSLPRLPRRLSSPRGQGDTAAQTASRKQRRYQATTTSAMRKSITLDDSVSIGSPSSHAFSEDHFGSEGMEDIDGRGSEESAADILGRRRCGIVSDHKLRVSEGTNSSTDSGGKRHWRNELGVVEDNENPRLNGTSQRRSDSGLVRRVNEELERENTDNEQSINSERYRHKPIRSSCNHGGIGKEPVKRMYRYDDAPILSSSEQGKIDIELVRQMYQYDETPLRSSSERVNKDDERVRRVSGGLGREDSGDIISSEQYPHDVFERADSDDPVSLAQIRHEVMEDEFTLLM